MSEDVEPSRLFETSVRVMIAGECHGENSPQVIKERDADPAASKEAGEIAGKLKNYLLTGVDKGEELPVDGKGALAVLAGVVAGNVIGSVACADTETKITPENTPNKGASESLKR